MIEESPTLNDVNYCLVSIAICDSSKLIVCMTYRTFSRYRHPSLLVWRVLRTIAARPTQTFAAAKALEQTVARARVRARTQRAANSAATPWRLVPRLLDWKEIRLGTFLLSMVSALTHRVILQDSLPITKEGLN